MQEEDIDALMARLSRGDRSAFDPLYAELAPRALRTCRRRLSPDEADDASQSALMKVFARASEFEPGRPALPWFYAVVFNEVTAVLRKRRPNASPERLDGLVSNDDGADVRLEDQELLARLSAAIDDLDPDARAAVLARLGDSKQPETPAMRKRVSRAVAKLRLLLGGTDAT